MKLVAQQLLNRTVSIQAKQQPISAVLQLISQQGNFYFSYVSTIFPKDSMVSISIKNKTVKQTLEIILDKNYLYKESGNHIILLKKASGQTYYHISGIVMDKQTGMRLANVSVYERQQLVTTLTNNDGYFKLRLMDKGPTVTLSISKELYADTLLTLATGYDQEITVSISPVTYQLKTVNITGYAEMERIWFANVFLSSKQQLTGLNIAAFLANKPYQVSLTPGLGTHGKMSGQVINKLSFNIVGGYAAGVNGVEVGTVFNMVKQDMEQVQIAGIVNVVGGKTDGVQLAGIHNHVLKTMKGVQVAGISNITGGIQVGVQIAGTTNRIDGHLQGAQIQGLVGVIRDSARGIQLAGIGNISSGDMTGIQVAGLFNYARRMNGMQIGLVNIADTAGGYSIGLLNVVRKGYYKAVLYSTETLPVNIACKTGNHRLYSILLGGIDANNEAWSVGYGMGTNIYLNTPLSLSTEVTWQNIYLSNWDRHIKVFRLQPSLHVKLAKQWMVFAGPAMVVKVADGVERSLAIPHTKYAAFNISNRLEGWLGWQAGISFF